jgi:hypothetical protein
MRCASIAIVRRPGADPELWRCTAGYGHAPELSSFHSAQYVFGEQTGEHLWTDAAPVIVWGPEGYGGQRAANGDEPAMIAAEHLRVLGALHTMLDQREREAEAENDGPRLDAIAAQREALERQPLIPWSRGMTAAVVRDTAPTDVSRETRAGLDLWELAKAGATVDQLREAANTDRRSFWATVKVGDELVTHNGLRVLYVGPAEPLSGHWPCHALVVDVHDDALTGTSSVRASVCHRTKLSPAPEPTATLTLELPVERMRALDNLMDFLNPADFNPGDHSLLTAVRDAAKLAARESEGTT